MAEETKTNAAPTLDANKSSAVSAAVERGVTVQGKQLEITGKPGETMTTTNDGKPQRPANVPEKFWDAEKGAVNTDALIKSYGELEAKQSQTRTPSKDLTSESVETPPQANEDPAAKVPQGVTQEDLTKAATEFTQTGKITEATYKALADKGMTPDVVNSVMAGFKAQGDKMVQDAFSITKTAENYAAMIAWAKTSLSQEELADFDQRVINPKVSKAAVKQLYAVYREAVGNEAEIVTPAGGKPEADTFKSRAEMVQAVSDKRYGKDAAYRDEVRAKLARTMKAGIVLQ